MIFPCVVVASAFAWMALRAWLRWRDATRRHRRHLRVFTPADNLGAGQRTLRGHLVAHAPVAGFFEKEVAAATLFSVKEGEPIASVRAKELVLRHEHGDVRIAGLLEVFGGQLEGTSGLVLGRELGAGRARRLAPGAKQVRVREQVLRHGAEVYITGVVRSEAATGHASDYRSEARDWVLDADVTLAAVAVNAPRVSTTATGRARDLFVGAALAVLVVLVGGEFGVSFGEHVPVAAVSPMSRPRYLHALFEEYARHSGGSPASHAAYLKLAAELEPSSHTGELATDHAARRFAHGQFQMASELLELHAAAPGRSGPSSKEMVVHLLAGRLAESVEAVSGGLGAEPARRNVAEVCVARTIARQPGIDASALPGREGFFGPECHWLEAGHLPTISARRDALGAVRQIDFEHGLLLFEPCLDDPTTSECVSLADEIEGRLAHPNSEEVFLEDASVLASLRTPARDRATYEALARVEDPEAPLRRLRALLGLRVAVFDGFTALHVRGSSLETLMPAIRDWEVLERASRRPGRSWPQVIQLEEIVVEQLGWSVEAAQLGALLHLRLGDVDGAAPYLASLAEYEGDWRIFARNLAAMLDPETLCADPRVRDAVTRIAGPHADALESTLHGREFDQQEFLAWFEGESVWVEQLFWVRHPDRLGAWHRSRDSDPEGVTRREASMSDSPGVGLAATARRVGTAHATNVVRSADVALLAAYREAFLNPALADYLTVLQ